VPGCDAQKKKASENRRPSIDSLCEVCGPWPFPATSGSRGGTFAPANALLHLVCLIETFTVRQQEITPREHRHHPGRIGSGDHGKAPDLLSDHQIGRLAEGMIFINDRRWALDELLERFCRRRLRIEQVATGQDAEEPRFAVQDREPLMAVYR
jgi:hypothetical protein